MQVYLFDSALFFHIFLYRSNELDVNFTEANE